MGPKVSKGRAESPLVAPAGVNPPVLVRMQCMTRKNVEAKYFVNALSAPRRQPVTVGTGGLFACTAPDHSMAAISWMARSAWGTTVSLDKKQKITGSS